jgi:ADP-ribosylglycohydrolase
MQQRSSRLFDKVLGCLLGGVIGDAMGQPAENKTYQEIAHTFGEITDFSGVGTDDSALKHLLCDAIIRSGGYPTADAWAEEWLSQEDLFLKRHIFWIPVMNAFWKIRGEDVSPRQAGNGDMASSSSAMGISPMGIINAGNPRQAALEAYDVAGLIHHNFCRDGACSMAAAVAEAFHPDASVGSILQAAVGYLPAKSARVMREHIESTLRLAREERDYAAFRERFYRERLLLGITVADSRETVPVALAIFYLADGDPRQTILFGANFGRDADTIASMAGAIAGAFRGTSAFPPEWIEKVETESSRSQRELAAALTSVILRRLADTERRAKAIKSLF